MLVYLSKKIAIPNNYRLNCIAWNEKQGFIAVGGEDGLLKVLRVESNAVTNNASGKTRAGSMATAVAAAAAAAAAGTSNLSMNQTLEGHNGQVQTVVWNEEHQKLTSSDQNGVIVVWMLHKGTWYEEMINNRNKSVVKGMAWSQDGQKICIVYEDGAVIVGSVDGNRIWGKELKNTSLSAVQWSPDGKLLLFGLKNGSLHLYDNQGVFLMEVNGETSAGQGGGTIVAMHWYDGRNGYASLDCPTLAICYESGRIQLMRGTGDENPFILETGITAVSCRWNSYGSLLAVTGTMPVTMHNGESKDCNALLFYTGWGEHVKTLKLPGREVSGCSWEGGSLRLALSVDSHIYFANIRPDYKWTYFAKTLVFTNERITSRNGGICINFWNTSNNTCCTKNVKALLSIASYGDHCTLAVLNDEERLISPSPSPSPPPPPPPLSPQQQRRTKQDRRERYALLVCNTIATPIDTRYLNVEPLFTTMTSNTVITASRNNFFVWNFRTPRSNAAAAGGRIHSRKDGTYHVDDTPTGVTQVIQDLDRADTSFEAPTSTRASSDPICCIGGSDKILLIGRESGMIQRYSLPQVTLTNRYSSVGSRARSIAINSNSTRASIIDVSGILRMLDLEEAAATIERTTDTAEEVAKFERKDVWAMRWAEDNPSLLAIMEKTRMYVIRGLDPEEPIGCSGYICAFRNLEIRCVLLDELVDKPEDPRADLIIDLEVKSLRDTKELLAKVGLREAHNFIQDNPHPRLWRLLAESSLNERDLEMAENAMVRCTDYLGIQFIKRLASVHNDQLKRAEVAAFLGNYDQAEKLYLEVDRRDLAINLRQKLGDYFRVLQLMKMGIGGSDKQIEEAYNRIGDYFRERQNWEGAREYYEKGRNVDKLIECYYKLEDYEQLAATLDLVPDKSPILKKLGRMLSSVGMCPRAVTAYLKYGDVKLAVDTCVRLNHWDQAVELAKTYKMSQIGDLLDKYANHLLSNGKILQAVELYKKANCYLEASRLLVNLAREQARTRGNPLRVKKLYVLSALMIEAHIDSMPSSTTSIGLQPPLPLPPQPPPPPPPPPTIGARSNLIMGLTESNDEHARLIENAWRGAEAYHFLLLAHRQIYDARYELAMKTCLRLADYEDILLTEDIYSLVALSTCGSRAFSASSKAFIKLEALESSCQASAVAPSSRHRHYEQLALEIFIKHPPKDTAPSSPKSECVHCETLVPDSCLACPNCSTRFPACVLSGKPLMDLSAAWICPVCRHHAATERDIVNINACPLCHSTITYL